MDSSVRKPEYTYAHTEDIQDINYHEKLIKYDTISVNTATKTYGIMVSSRNFPIVSNTAEKSTVKWVAVNGELTYELGAIHLTSDDYKKLATKFTNATGYTLDEPSMTESEYLASIR